MTMFRLIGGSARCGKSALVRQVSHQYQGQLISLDNLRHSYLAIASSELYGKLRPPANVEDNSKDAWLDLLRTRDRAMWRGAKAYLESAAILHDDVMMEGCLWPDYINELTTDFRAVFLVDTSPEHVERLMIAAHDPSTHNNWMSGRSDEWLRKWAAYNIERSKFYIQLAKEYNQPVFDIGELGFQDAQARAIEYLFSD